jgi:hypothetical protein
VARLGRRASKPVKRESHNRMIKGFPESHMGPRLCFDARALSPQPAKKFSD